MNIAQIFKNIEEEDKNIKKIKTNLTDEEWDEIFERDNLEIFFQGEFHPKADKFFEYKEFYEKMA